MTNLIRLLANIKLRAKILGISGIFLAGMIVVIGTGGYVLTRQNDLLEISVNTASSRVAAANLVELSILRLDRAVQALIAADTDDMIRTAAIASIRAGATLDEELTKLKQIFESKEVDRLMVLMAEVRPKQMEVIAAARRNDDTAALQGAAAIAPSFEEITSLATQIVELSRHALNQDLVTAKSDAITVIKVLGLFCAFGALLGLVIAVAAAGMMSRPLAHVEHVMRALAVGDLTQPVDTAGAGQDEIGCTLRAIDTMVTRLRELIGRIGESSCKVSNVAQAVSQSAAEVESGSRDFDRSISRIRAQTEQLHDTTRMASTQIEDANRHAGEATAASQVSSDRILQSVHNFEQFRREMETTAGKSRELESITDQITGIIQTIGGISRQTNLLALNAAIEAARAGEQGRGFAVVADEVRTLAGHTSKAVDEISGLIGSINNSVHETVASMEKALADATSNIDQLQAAADGTRTSSEQIKAISQSMHELVGLVETQNHSAGSIAEAAEQLSGISSSNRVQSQELHLRSDNLRAAAGELEDVVSLFKV